MMKRLLLCLLFICGLSSPAIPQQAFNSRAVINGALSGDNTIVAAVANKRIMVWGFDFSLASPVNVTLKCGSTALTGAMTMNAWSKPVTANQAYWVCDTNVAFIINLSSGVQTSGVLWYSIQ